MLALWMLAFAVPEGMITAHAEQQPVENMTNVVVFAHFKGDGNKEYFNKALGNYTHVGKKIKELYAGDYGRSFQNYMKTVSGEKLNVNTIFPQMDASGNVTAYELPYSLKQAQENNIDYNIITDILNNANLKITEDTDQNRDGAVDNLTVIMVGSAGNTGASMPSLYPHQNSYPGDVKLNGKYVRNYNMLNTDRMLGTGNGTADESGLIIHEFLHSLGYPDLYRKANEDYPVYTWDIMGQSSKYVCWPLAYMRMHFSKWTDLPELTSSKSGVKIEKANDAVILKAPGNPYELFVVESRVQRDRNDINTLDSGIGGSGLIVYRIDTTVNALSNQFGKTGVYIFRENAAKTKEAVMKKAAHTGGTVGRSEKGATLEEGALSYSDGSNSCVEISNISFNKDTGEASFDVSMPDASEYDLWQDTVFPEGSRLAACTVSGTPYAVGVSGKSVQLYKYRDGGWTAQGSAYSSKNAIEDMQLLECDGRMILLYITDANEDQYGYKESLKTLFYDPSGGCKEGPSQTLTGEGNEFQSFSADTMGGDVYVNYVSNGYKTATIAKIDGDRFENIKDYINVSSGMYGSPVITAEGGAVYYGIRNAANQNEIELWKYEGTQHTALQSPGSSGAYNIKSHNGRLYCTFGSNQKLEVKLYDASSDSWGGYAARDVDSFELEMAIAQGNLYIVTKPSSGTSGDKKLRVYALQEVDGTAELKQEGEPVAIPSSGGGYGLIASKDNLFTYYISESGEAAVSRKTTVNRLLSLTVKPPSKLSYIKGDTVDESGLEVTANYVNNSRTLSRSEYTVNGFNADKAGVRTAAISYGGLENTFTYQVFEQVTFQKASQTITGRSAFSRVFGSSSFNLGASAKTKITYKSGNSSIAVVSASGTVTFRNPGETYIYVKAAESENYKAAEKKVRISSYLKTPSLNVSNAKGRKAKLVWGKTPGATKYQIYVRKPGKKNYVKLTEKKSNVTRYTNSKLKKRKTYQYKVRAYRVVNGKTVYSSFSPVRSVRIKK